VQSLIEKWEAEQKNKTAAKEVVKTSQMDSKMRSDALARNVVSFPEIKKHYSLDNMSDEEAFETLKSYEKLKYCQRVKLPKKMKDLVTELGLTEGQLSKPVCPLLCGADAARLAIPQLGVATLAGRCLNDGERGSSSLKACLGHAYKWIWNAETSETKSTKGTTKAYTNERDLSNLGEAFGVNKCIPTVCMLPGRPLPPARPKRPAPPAPTPPQPAPTNRSLFEDCKPCQLG
jgi:hypothetical protein